ncbi:LuxR family transcriptional regulator [Nocardioides sp. Soil777]|uniref:TrmB family transcriptional regulator n=1 Tax=Nocardioides sp. Soil777 TaxID=1736409 RepID=UPI000702EA6F|nr:hypothetical protein [Nocardioides sp. Soil777]KRF00881.1 LuxR family transcriptional regulator [Nocardioides sp. Soil777]
MTSFGPGERTLFESAATALYDEIATQGGIPKADPRIADRGPDREAFDLLQELGLVTADELDATWVAVDPATVQSRVVAPLGQQGAELITESGQWAQAFSNLSQTWRQSPGSVKGPFTELRGEAIGPYITSSVADASEELLTAQPQTGRAMEQLPQAIEREVAALRRGVTMRTLYQHAARRSSATHKYVAAVAAEGAQVRTLDEFFNRLIVVDRRLAIIPTRVGPGGLALREPSLVLYLVDIFERSWERARPFTNRETPLMRDIAAEQRAMTIRMLVGGHADPVGAKRLGVSPRTYAAYVSDLKHEFQVDTRFQLGYEMGRRGITGNDAEPHVESDRD